MTNQVGQAAVAEMLVPDAERYDRRERAAIAYVAVHRISVHQEDAAYDDTPADVIRFFHEHPIGVDASGGKMPYAVLIGRDGEVTQCVPLGRVTPHVRGHNRSAIGIGCLGDFREDRVAPAQWRSLVVVCRSVLSGCRLEPSALVAHDRLPGASRDPDKICPGQHLDLDRLRDDVTRTQARLDLIW